jgi:hypothetical protein
MGYLNELLSRNPLVIDGDTIRLHHKYTDDLYTGGIKMAMDKNIKLTINGNSAPKQTNYDRIKSMSVEDLTKFISNITKVVAVKLGEDYVVNGKQFIQQWLLQEVSDEN